MTCTFFGHHDTPDSVAPRLESLLKHVIEAGGVRKFYVGSQGKFDSLVKRTLFKLRETYPDIVCYAALYTFVKKTISTCRLKKSFLTAGNTPIRASESTTATAVC